MKSLKSLAKKYYETTQIINDLEGDRLKLREELMGRVSFGQIEKGGYLIEKQHHDSTLVQAYIRRPFDSISVDKI